MSRLMLALLIFIMALTAFAPPGLCPCWLLAHVEQFHPHAPSQAQRPHSHDYLFEIYPAHSAADMPAALIPAALFVLLLAGLGHWRTLFRHEQDGVAWNLPVDSPPPRRRRLCVAAPAA